MKLESVSISGFLSYGDKVEVDLSNLAYASITGHNGAGKSTIPLAITWALFGTLRVRGDSNSIVNDDFESAVVEVVMSSDDTRVKVRRVKARDGSSTLRLFDDIDGDWVQRTDHLNKVAQGQINEMVKMSEDAWYSLVLMDYASSGGGTRFTKSDPELRRSILMSLVPELSLWKDLENSARQRRRDIMALLERHDGSLDTLDTQIKALESRLSESVSKMEEVDLADVEAEIKALDDKIVSLNTDIGLIDSAKGAAAKEMKQGRSVYEARVSAVRETIKYAENVIASHERLERKTFDLMSDVERLEQEAHDTLDRIGVLDLQAKTIESDLLRANRKKVRLVKEIEGVAAPIREIERQITDLRIQVSELNEHLEHGEATCRVCNSPLSNERARSLIEDARSHIASLEVDLSPLIERRTDIERSLDETKGRIDDLTSNIARVERKTSQAKTDLEAGSRLVANVERQRKETLKELASIDKDTAVATRNRGIAEMEEIESEWSKREADLEADIERSSSSDRERTLTSELTKANKERRQLAATRDQALRLESQVEGLERDLGNARKQLRDGEKARSEDFARLKRTEWLVKAFQPKGIPVMLLDSVLSSIEDEQNRILSSIPGAEGMSVQFRQVKSLKGGGERETLDIIVTTKDGFERPIESFSSGELVRLTISNLFAMISVFKRRIPGLVDALFLDEPLGPLDSEAVPAFIEVLRSAMEDGTVSSVLVITHDQRIIEALPQQVVVSRLPNGDSHVQVL